MRDYAAERKTAASPDEFKLHAITRNALKVEVVKVYGRRLPGGTAPSFWSTFWPRLAWAGGGVFVLVLVVSLILLSEPGGNDDQRTLVRNDQVTVVSAANEKTAPPAPRGEQDSFASEPMAVDLLAGRGSSMNSGLYQFHTVPQPRPAIPASPLASQPVARKVAVDLSVVPTAESRAVPTAAAPVASTVRSTPVVQVALPPLLASFQIQISGDQMVVIDQDESRYVGRIQPIASNPVSSGNGISSPADLGSPDDPLFPERYRSYSAQGGRRAVPSQSGQFTVAGTNLTSGLPVRFTGNLRTWTRSGTENVSSAETSSSTILQIDGTATQGTEPAVSINATTSP